MASSSSSSSTTALVKKYDVFLSFRGEDTRNNLTNVILGAMRRESINVFIDDDLERGDQISESLLNAIEESFISVIIFSKRYASSRWCLQELVKILDCQKRFGQVVLPVFYFVDPSHVRNREADFGREFAILEERFIDELETVERWRKALTDAANISGWTSDYRTPEYDLTKKVVEYVLATLNQLSPSDDKELVGMGPVIKKIESSISKGSKRVEILGIWGMGGIGKTTITNVIFNKHKIYFQGSYFARNVREASHSHNGLASLHKELLSTILSDQYSNKNSNFTRARCGRRKVFIVFDDVTCFDQIENLIGDPRCLGEGSCVIITTRDRQVLINYGVSHTKIYKIEGLLPHEAQRLFNRYAFVGTCPNVDYFKLSKKVVNYCKGLPLALKVLGCFLCCKPKDIWKSAIKKLEKIPHADIQKVLEVSYDGLDDVEREIFLDIACFLKWEKKDFVIEFLNACDFDGVESGISVLIDKCLISILDDDEIMMHDLLQEMGWEVVRQQSIKYPGKRSGLLNHKDIRYVLEEKTGTEAIEGICLDMSKEQKIINLEPSALAIMCRLRFFKLHNSQCCEDNNIIINTVHIMECEDPKLTFAKLRYLCWHGYPMVSLPSRFPLINLAAMDMTCSKIQQLWTGVQLVKLKYINLSHCKNLKKIQDLSTVPNLESLILEGCTSLFQISSSTQCLKKLVILNLKRCESLQSLLTGIQLESLRKLIISYCSNLKMFPIISPNIVEELLCDETAIEELPPSFCNQSKLAMLNLKNCSMLKDLPSNICELKSLEHLNLSGCSKLHGLPDKFGNLGTLKVLKAEKLTKCEVPSSIVYLSVLRELNLSDCSITELPEDLGRLSSLESLLLGRNKFKRIPTSIMHLSKLFYFDLSCCQSLQFLPELPSNLHKFDAHSCTSLEASSIRLHNIIPPKARINFSNCLELETFALKEILRDAPQKMGSYTICFPGKEIPKWFSISTECSFVTLALPRYGSLFTLLVCAVVEFRNYRNDDKGLAIGCDLVFRHLDRTDLCHGSLTIWDHGTGPDNVDSSHVFLGYLTSDIPRFPGYRRQTTIQFYVENLNIERVDRCNVKKCGVWNPRLNIIPRTNQREDGTLTFWTSMDKNFFEGEASSRQSPDSQAHKRLCQ